MLYNNSHTVYRRKHMSWNKVFDYFISLKHEYERNYGPTDYNKNVIELWSYDTSLYLSSVSDYLPDILSGLKITQKGTDILLHYDKYDKMQFSDFWDKYNGFFRECRSLVIDLENEEIILSPFAKFFNINEIPDNSLESLQVEISNADKVEFTPKMDGSMQAARWYRGDVYMSGSQALDENLSWRLKMGKGMLTQQHKSMLLLYNDFTFIFEMIALEDAHVVKYKKSDEGLYLVGMRHVKTGQQMPYSFVRAIASLFDIKTVSDLSLTLDEAIENAHTLKASEAEGYVLNIQKGDRTHLVKIKGEEYVHLHRVINKIISPNMIIEVIANDQYDDFISSIPEAYKENCEKVKKDVLTYIKYFDENVHQYYRHLPKSSKVEFMKAVNNIPRQFRHYVRNLWNGVENNYLIVGTNGYKKYSVILEEMRNTQ